MPTPPKPFPLVWREKFDDLGNTAWEANSPWHDRGIPFLFRIKQRLRDNKIEFYNDSDAQLMAEDDQAWLTLDEAKAWLRNDADNLVSDDLTVSKATPEQAAQLMGETASETEQYRQAFYAAKEVIEAPADLKFEAYSKYLKLSKGL